MIEECFLHIGMHKTGSSSIQESLKHLKTNEYEYLNLGSSNHTRYLMLMLSGNRKNLPTNLQLEISQEDFFIHQKRLQEEFEDKLKSSKSKRIIISSEWLSSAQESELNKLKAILGIFCKKIRVIGYVRPFISYLQSAFQERIKTLSITEINLTYVIPKYQNRFHKFESIFGKESINLRLFDQKNLFKGDVTLDFCKTIGLDSNAITLTRTNESISLEAVSLLYFYSKFGRNSQNYKKQRSDNLKFAQLINKIGSNRLIFSNKLVNPIIEACQKDIEWMSEWIGVSVLDQPTESEHAIESENDLLRVAMDQAHKVRDLWFINDTCERTPEGIAKLITRLRLVTLEDQAPFEHDKNQLGFSTVKLKNELNNSNGDIGAQLRVISNQLNSVGYTRCAKNLIEVSSQLRKHRQLKTSTSSETE